MQNPDEERRNRLNEHIGLAQLIKLSRSSLALALIRHELMYPDAEEVAYGVQKTLDNFVQQLIDVSAEETGIKLEVMRRVYESPSGIINGIVADVENGADPVWVSPDGSRACAHAYVLFRVDTSEEDAEYRSFSFTTRKHEASRFVAENVVPGKHDNPLDEQNAKILSRA